MLIIEKIFIIKILLSLLQEEINRGNVYHKSALLI